MIFSEASGYGGVALAEQAHRDGQILEAFMLAQIPVHTLGPGGPLLVDGPIESLTGTRRPASELLKAQAVAVFLQQEFCSYVQSPAYAQGHPIFFEFIAQLEVVQKATKKKKS